MTGEKTQKGRKLIALLLTIAYAAVHLLLISKHEIWRDEAYVWGFVKNGSFEELFTELSRVGHPFLWFAWLLPFVKLGLPFSCMGIASLIPMTAAVWILLSSKELPFPAALAVVAGPVFLYFNVVIVRPYALSVLFLALLIVFWKTRLQHPWRYCLAIALLLQTHVIFAGFCGGLLLELWMAAGKKEKGVFAAGVLPVISAFSLIPQLLQRGDPDVTVSLSGRSRLEYITQEHILEGLRSVFQYNNSLLRLPLSLLTAAAVLVFAVAAFANKKGRYRSGIPAFCGVVWYYLCVCLIRPVEHVHMAGCLLMLLAFLFACVIAEDGGERSLLRLPAWILLILFGVSGWMYTAKGAVKDLQGPYSGSLEVARFVIEQLPQGSVLGLEEMQDTEAPVAYISEKRGDLHFYNAWKGEDWSYYRWLRGKRPEPEAIAETLRETGGHDLYYLTRKELPEEAGATLCFQNSRESVWGEDYYLYRIEQR